MTERRYDPAEYQRGYEAGIRGHYCPCGCSLDYAEGWYEGMQERDAALRRNIEVDPGPECGGTLADCECC